MVVNNGRHPQLLEHEIVDSDVKSAMKVIVSIEFSLEAKENMELDQNLNH